MSAKPDPPRSVQAGRKTDRQKSRAKNTRAGSRMILLPYHTAVLPGLFRQTDPSFQLTAISPPYLERFLRVTATAAPDTMIRASRPVSGAVSPVLAALSADAPPEEL